MRSLLAEFHREASLSLTITLLILNPLLREAVLWTGVYRALVTWQNCTAWKWVIWPYNFGLFPNSNFSAGLSWGVHAIPRFHQESSPLREGLRGPTLESQPLPFQLISQNHSPPRFSYYLGTCRSPIHFVFSPTFLAIPACLIHIYSIQ